MAAMLVGALRRGSGCRGGLRLIAHSLRRFVSTLVVAEHEGGFVKPSSLSALAAAEAIAKDNKVSVLLGGSGPALHKAADHAACSHPLVSEVLVADSEALAHPLAEPWAELLRSVQQKGGYSHVIASSTSFGKNLLPRAAALLDVSPVTDVTAVKEPHVFVRPIYAGNALCTVKYTGEGPCMMSIRSTSFSPATEAMSETKVAPITQVDLSFLSEGKSTWVNLTSQDTERPDLANAPVVVTGGRGLKSAENFKLLEQLAEKLGAAVGATRAAVDAGYVPNDLQVRLLVYHEFCIMPYYGLVADLFEVLDELLKKIPEKK
ncbi:Electron transfer flavoprotein subunit alpha mitochondrial [Zea mays]|uniref:Electron transfer flavoprotein subunit alpha n=1 Tax=Zea mays TaxID=4577 RepID=A0A1D6LAL1_MAIZE|nr:Electron transfer flavoprotein subunit alpha mitochondrial [Zea mays]